MTDLVSLTKAVFHTHCCDLHTTARISARDREVQIAHRNLEVSLSKENFGDASPASPTFGAYLLIPIVEAVYQVIASTVTWRNMH